MGEKSSENYFISKMQHHSMRACCILTDGSYYFMTMYANVSEKKMDFLNLACGKETFVDGIVNLPYLLAVTHMEDLHVRVVFQLFH